MVDTNVFLDPFGGGSGATVAASTAAGQIAIGNATGGWDATSNVIVDSLGRVGIGKVPANGMVEIYNATQKVSINVQDDNHFTGIFAWDVGTGYQSFFYNEDYDFTIASVSDKGLANFSEKLRISTSGDTYLYGDIWFMSPTTDVATAERTISGQDALPAATVNQDGGNLTFKAGGSATAAGTGGDLILDNAPGTTANGQIKMPSLPTSDPTIAGALWNNSGVLTVSAG